MNRIDKKNTVNTLLDVLIFLIVIYIPLLLLVLVSDNRGHSFTFSPDADWFNYNVEMQDVDETKSDEFVVYEKWNSNEGWNLFENDWGK